MADGDQHKADSTEEDEANSWSRFLSKISTEPEIQLEVLSRLPTKTIFRFKCVSKAFNNLTTEPHFLIKHSQLIHGNCFTGFFCQSKKLPLSLFYYNRIIIEDVKMGQPDFLPLEPNSCSVPDPSFKFLLPQGVEQQDSAIELLDSCHGLVLCYRFFWTFGSFSNISFNKICFVCNPLTKEHVELPQMRKRSNRVYYSLIADTAHTGCINFKVVCVSRPKFSEPCSKLSILSSEKGVWEHFEERLPCLAHETMMGSKLIFNGKLHWDCLEGYILVCPLDVRKSEPCYELIEAPRAPLGRCLWKFQNKILCYCFGYENEFPAWSLGIDDKKWKLEKSDEFEKENSRDGSTWVEDYEELVSQYEKFSNMRISG
ncbi:putative F-box family protein [Tripterygium wilfordii]|uniref:Putative F-box family protein n=1 Tax=Tripterygium wilfordii TaxID=458696 RepID=A0A7J7CWD4_TRIWF|nr:putative F-box family protein [Tripterygium wilfordii]